MQRIALLVCTTASITSTLSAQSFTACVGRRNVTCENDSFTLLNFMCTLLGTRPTRGREEYNFIIARPVDSRSLQYGMVTPNRTLQLRQIWPPLENTFNQTRLR